MTVHVDGRQLGERPAPGSAALLGAPVTSFGPEVTACPCRRVDRDVMPLTSPQLASLLGAVWRELSWSQRSVTRLLTVWRARAAEIPDPRLRLAALHALDTKRGHTHGAGLFAVLPRRRAPGLLRLLALTQLLWDTLDSMHEIHEQQPSAAHGLRLHQALGDALDPERPPADWFADGPSPNGDGGYVAALVDACRAAALALPSYPVVLPLLRREAKYAKVCALNHVEDRAERDAALRDWADTVLPDAPGLPWYEVTAAASSSLTILALLAVSADPGLSEAHAEAVRAAYWPASGVATAGLDSWVDRADDRRMGAYAHVDHYPHEVVAMDRIALSIEQSADRLLALQRGHRHAVIIAGMIALYLSKEPTLSPASQRLLAAGGTLPRLMLPALRTWRRVRDQRV